MFCFKILQILFRNFLLLRHELESKAMQTQDPFQISLRGSSSYSSKLLVSPTKNKSMADQIRRKKYKLGPFIFGTYGGLTFRSKIAIQSVV